MIPHTYPFMVLAVTRQSRWYFAFLATVPTLVVTPLRAVCDLVAFLFYHLQRWMSWLE